jgi:hypothetical protein
MYTPPRNNIQQRSLVSQMCVICLHLSQRVLTIRFFAGLFTGIILTLILYPRNELSDKPKFRPDQSKFEYEKNQLPTEDIDISKSSVWNSSWDRFNEFFNENKTETFLISIVYQEKINGHDIFI